VQRPSPPTTEAEREQAREQILEQHGALRRLLAAAKDAATATARGDVWSALRLPTIIGEVLRQLERHLAFEEAVLVPCLAGPGPAGMISVDHLLAEHARQRQELATLLELSRSADDARGLALTLQTLISDVLVDMTEEEQTVLKPPRPTPLAPAAGGAR
jgi:iron-sulfur cluster repair protein YtfE (RIC family)